MRAGEHERWNPIHGNAVYAIGHLNISLLRLYGKIPSPGRFQIQDKKYFCTKETRFLLFLFSLLGLIFLVIHREEKGSQDSSLFPSAQDGGRKARERGRKEGFRWSISVFFVFPREKVWVLIYYYEFLKERSDIFIWVFKIIG